MQHDSIPNGLLYGSSARVSGLHPFPAGTRGASVAHSYVPDYANSSRPQLIGSSYPQSPHRDIGTRFGLKLRELRRTHKMTQIEMAVMLGIDRSYISEVERGKKGISLVTLEIIAIGFRVHLSDLLRDL